jgi:hypothetical protein
LKSIQIHAAEAFYAPLLIGDIVHYAKEIDDEYLLDELDELAEIISMAISATKSTPV